MSVGPTRGPVERPGIDRDVTEIFQRVTDLERMPPGRWIYVGTYPTDPDTTPDSPPFENGWVNVGGGERRLRFRRNTDWSLDIEGTVAGGPSGTTVTTLNPLYRPSEDVAAPGVGGDWVLESAGPLVFTESEEDDCDPCAEIATHIADTLDAHMASAIGYLGRSDLPEDNVQDAIDFLLALISAGGVLSISKSGDTPLTGDVTLSAGANVTLTQVGQDIAIASTGGGGGGGELDYVEKTTDSSVTATTPATANTLVTGAAVAYDGATKIVVKFFAPSCDCAGITSLVFQLYDGSADVGTLGAVTFASTNQQGPVNLEREFIPAAGTRTYSVRAYANSNNCTVRAGSGGAGFFYFPMFMRITTA